MKLSLAILTFTLFSTKAFSQVNLDSTMSGNAEPAVYTYVEQMPEFPGGETALLTYLRTNIEYPDSARIKNIGGKVYIRFVVDGEGKVTKTNVARSVHPLIDAEAVRVVQQMPAWKPGRQNGKPVSVYYTLPVSFRLE